MNLKRILRRTSFALTNPKFTFRRLRVGAIGASTIELSEIKNHSGEVFSILEAGAANGEDTDRMLKKFPFATIYAFEPVERSYSRLLDKFSNESRVQVFRSALSAESGSTTLYVSSDKNSASGQGSSSILLPTQHLKDFPSISFSEDDRQLVETVILDEWAKARNIESFDLVWFDLQGMEKLVIESSPKVLGNSKFIHIEVSRKPLFAGGCSYQEINEILNSMGFVKRIERVGLVSGNVLYERMV